MTKWFTSYETIMEDGTPTKTNNEHRTKLINFQLLGGGKRNRDKWRVLPKNKPSVRQYMKNDIDSAMGITRKYCD